MRGGKQSSAYYPISLNLTGRRCVVVGGGTVALRKVKGLLQHGATVEVISPALCPELEKLVTAKAISLLRRDFEAADLKDAFMTVAATAESSTNKKVADEARRQWILVNVVDSPELSDFIVPSCLQRGRLSIAVSTGGASPALARKLRTRLEQDFREEYASLTDLVGEVRSELRKKAVIVSGDDWQKALDLDMLLDLIRSGQREKAKAILLDRLKPLETGKSTRKS